MKYDNLGLTAMYEPAFLEMRMAMINDKSVEKAGIQEDRLLSKWLGSRVLPNGLGVISITGALGYWYGPSYQGIATAFEAMEEDDSVEKILLDINSPGGAVSGLIELAEVIGRSKKPVLAYCEGITTSAAYLMASTASKIYSTKQTMIGSIGVIVSYLDDSKLMSDIGYEVVTIRSKNAQKKNLDLKSDEGRAEIQKSVNELETLFIAKIANNRGVTPDDVIAKFGQGLTFHAEEAMGLGMVDEIVTDFDACVAKIMPSLVGGGGVVMGENVAIALTIETLKAQHPELASLLTEEGRVAGFNAGKAEGVTDGAVAERKRIADLSVLKGVAFGAEVVEEAIKNGQTVEQAKSAILDKQLGAVRSGQAQPVAATLAELATESAGATVNPAIPVVEANKEESKIDNAVDKAVKALKLEKE